jgi:DNA-binding transcriptional LysR family regulator
MDLNAVRILVEVVDRGSFTAAGRAIGLPTSSVSRRVAQLERDLGVPLLVRTTRKLAVTEAGRLYIERAREAVRSLTEAGAVAAEAGSEPRGRVRLTASSDTADFLAAMLVAFARLYPGIEVDVLLTSRSVDLVAESIDLAIRGRARMEDSSLIARRIGPSPVRLYAAPSYLAERGAPRRVRDLARHECVLYRAGEGVQRWTLDGPRGREAVEVRGQLSSDDIAFCRHAAIAGGGIALVPSVLAAPAVAAGELAAVLPRHGLLSGGLYLVHAGGRALPRRVALLRDFLAQALAPLIEHWQALAHGPGCPIAR